MLRLLRQHSKDNDLQRIEQLYIEFRAPLWNYAYKILHDEHLADDVVQSVFAKAIQKSEFISALDCNKSKAYFVIMVRNLSYTLYRNNQRHPHIGLDELSELIPDENDSVERTVIRQLEHEELHEMLNSLREPYRDVLTLKYLYDLPDNEIAEIMGVKANNIRVMAHRALKSLKKLYQQREEAKD